MNDSVETVKPVIPSRRLFITGTDTEVGKTVFTVNLMQALQSTGQRVAGFKPIAAGGLEPYPDDLEESKTLYGNEDALRIREQSSFQQSYRGVNPTLFAEPIAPHLAAEKLGASIQVADHVAYIEHEITRLEKEAPEFISLIEGAGGWRVPVNENEYFSDLALRLKSGVILVVAIRLGCINHALMAAETIINDGVPLLGWVANCCEKDTLFVEENIEAIKARVAAPLIARLPLLPNPGQGGATGPSNQQNSPYWIDTGYLLDCMAINK